MGIFKNVKMKQVAMLLDPDTHQQLKIENEEVKPYLVLLTDFIEGQEEPDEGRWVATRGRTSVVSYICSEIFQVDPLKSFIITGSIKLGTEVSIYSFIRFCIEKNKCVVELDLNDIEDYTKSLYPDVDLNLVYAKEMNQTIEK